MKRIKATCPCGKPVLLRLDATIPIHKMPGTDRDCGFSGHRGVALPPSPTTQEDQSDG